MLWCMQRTNIYLEKRQTEALDRIASAAGVSRAEVVRRIVDRAIDSGGDAVAADLAAIDLSFGCLADVEFDLPGRGTGPREEHLTGMWSRP